MSLREVAFYLARNRCKGLEETDRKSPAQESPAGNPGWVPVGGPGWTTVGGGTDWDSAGFCHFNSYIALLLLG